MQNLAYAETFLATIGNPFPCWQLIPERQGCKERPVWKYGKLDERKSWLIQSNSLGQGVFCTVNIGDGQGRSANNITQATCLFVDVDEQREKPHDDFPLPPTMIVESSPGRYHYYWRASNISLEDFPRFQDSLTRRFGGDEACKDISRVMRVPGFVHWKREPFVSRIVEVNEQATYDISDLIEAYRLNEAPPRSFNDYVGPCINTGWVGEGRRHRTLVYIVKDLKQRGFSGQALFEAANAWNRSCCSPPLQDSEVERIVKWGDRRVDQRMSMVIRNGANQLLPEEVEQRRETLEVEILSTAEIQHSEFETPSFIISEILPEGFTILAGRPKIGKSWLSFQWALDVARGAQTMGVVPTSKCDVLLLALEDPFRRLAQRLHMILHNTAAPDNCRVATKWSFLPNALDDLRRFLDRQPNTRLVIIDTLGMIIGENSDSSGNAYFSDYMAIAALRTLAHERSISILAVHHLRKGATQDELEAVSGTTGITGASDAVLILKRPDRMSLMGELYCTGRDVVDRSIKIGLQEGCRWVVDESVEQKPDIKSEVFMVFDDKKPHSIEEVITAIYPKPTFDQRSRVKSVIQELLQEGVLESSIARNKYILAP